MMGITKAHYGKYPSTGSFATNRRTIASSEPKPHHPRTHLAVAINWGSFSVGVLLYTKRALLLWGLHWGPI